MLTASSTARKANCRGSSRGPVMPFRWVNTSLSKDLMTTDVRGEVITGGTYDCVRAGEGCECGVIKPAVKHIQIVSQLRVLHGVGGGFPIVADVLQAASPHSFSVFQSSFSLLL